MTWLWVILGVSAIGGILGYLSSGKKNAFAVAFGAAMGCGKIIFQIFIAILVMYVLIKFNWLFNPFYFFILST